ncbi:response regulator [Sagittula sp. NFXS13]|uniref:response regulator n=1 Tax=Sagittula sp. NFXS13 TaxID=2819095 RepID=UPI0032DF7B08
MADKTKDAELAAIRAAYRTDGLQDRQRASFEVLVLDDSRFDQNQIKRACGKTGLPVTTRLTSDMDEFSQALDEKAYDVILIDYMLPKGNGLTAQRLVNNHAMNFGAAVVMISSEMRTDVAVASMKKGSMDCLNKDALDPEKLREIMMASAKIFSEASRHWIGELLAQQRVQIAQDVAKVVRDEMEFGRFVDTIDKRIIDMLASKGFTEPENWNVSYLFDADEPLKFR